MKCAGLRFGLLVFCLCFFAGQGWAQGSCEDSSAATKLNEAFTAFCGGLGGGGQGICKGVDSLDRKYLILEAACDAKPNSPGCTEFVCASTQAKGHETLAPLVLALDHRTGHWAARNRLATKAQRRVKFDVAGQPTVSLARHERIVVVVENTNPLLYAATAGTPTEEDVPELASIQQLLTLLGGNLAAFVQVLATERGTRASAGPNALDTYREEVTDFVKHLRTDLDEAGCYVDQVTLQTTRAVNFVQAVELSKGSEYPVKPLQCNGETSLDPDAVAQAFQAVQITILEPAKKLEGCVPLLEAAQGLITADLADSDKVAAALTTLEGMQTSCSQQAELSRFFTRALSLESVSNHLQKVLAHRTTVKGNAEELAFLTGLSQRNAEQQTRFQHLSDQKQRLQTEIWDRLGKVRVALQDGHKQIQGQLDTSIRLGKTLTQLCEESAALLAKRDAAQKAATQIAIFEERLDRYRRTPDRPCDQNDSSAGNCTEVDALDLRLILEPQLKGVQQTKIQKHSVTVKPQSAYADKVVAIRPAEVTGSYTLDSVLRGLWGISASLTYTPLDSPTFGAVTSEDNEEEMILAMTDETTRAGEIALLADFRLGRWLSCRRNFSNCDSKYDWLGVEFGAGVSDEPAFFAGLSLRPSRSWRVGIGYTYQRVKELQDSLELGQIIPSADDIKTRDTFDGDWYISLSFALDSLKLFSAGD